MRLVVRVAAAAIALLGVLSVGSAQAVSRGTIEGKVFDLSCPGPCVEHPDPPLYSGDQASLVVTRLADGRRVAVASPDGGRFRLRLAPARYRLRIGFGDDRCWEGDTVRARVRAAEPTKVRLEVRNACLLAHPSTRPQ